MGTARLPLTLVEDDRVHPVYDPFDAAFQDDPYPAYAWLREHDPVHHHAKTAQAPAYWALTRFADVWDAVRRPEDFSSAQGLTFYPDEIGQLGLAPTIVMLDPPVQTQLRGLVGKGFTPRRVAALEDDIRTFVRGLIAGFGPTTDLHRDFSSRIPTFVLAELLGVPEADRARFDPWVSTLTALADDGFAASAATAGAEAVAEMFEYFAGVIEERRRHPQDDLVGALVAAEVEGPDGSPERLSDWDVLGFCFVMVAGGNDTTGALISHGIGLLDDFPDQRRLLLEDPGLIPGAVGEFLRMESSVQGLARTTTRDVEVAGVTIPAGEKVLMLYGSANRDVAEFGEDADRLDVRRDAARHLAFSSGPHFCIGSHLAKLQARVAFEELLAAHPDVGVDRSRGVRHRSAFTRGWETLPATGVSTP